MQKNENENKNKYKYMIIKIMKYRVEKGIRAED